MAFGQVQVIKSLDEKSEKLNGLLQKYFGEMDSGTDYRPITDKELKQTSVYRIKIEHWSGKRNWPERTDQAEGSEWSEGHGGGNGGIDERDVIICRNGREER